MSMDKMLPSKKISSNTGSLYKLTLNKETFNFDFKCFNDDRICQDMIMIVSA